MTMNGVMIDVDEAITRYRIAKQSADLQARHAAIFEDKFGVKDGVMKSYADVGRKFGISPERVRQLCGLVLHKIGLMP
jgi:DNA-directed RNA polymerase sigma subunit (sigma70/sigma32)